MQFKTSLEKFEAKLWAFHLPVPIDIAKKFVSGENRRILTELNPDGKKKMHKDRLLTKGFDFKYFSSIYKTKDNRIYHFVYDQGYTELDNDWFLLVENKKGG